MVNKVAAIKLSFLSGILVRNRLELIASTTYVEIEIKAPINAPLMSIKVSAAKKKGCVFYRLQAYYSNISILVCFFIKFFGFTFSSFSNTSLNIVLQRNIVLLRVQIQAI